MTSFTKSRAAYSVEVDRSCSKMAHQGPCIHISGPRFRPALPPKVPTGRTPRSVRAELSNRVTLGASAHAYACGVPNCRCRELRSAGTKEKSRTSYRTGRTASSTAPWAPHARPPCRNTAAVEGGNLTGRWHVLRPR